MRTLKLNQYAQGLRPLAEGIEGFRSLPTAEARDVLRELGGMIQQAHTSPEEVAGAIA